jgi:hypothetical protein
MLDTEHLYEHTWTIAAIVKDGVCLATEYIDGRTEVDRTKIVALLEYVSYHGPPLGNDRKFKKVQDEIFEFRSRQDRLLAFYDGRHRIVLANACTKKRDKLDPQEVRRALALRAEYLESKKQ